MWQNDESNLPRISKQNDTTALYNVPPPDRLEIFCRCFYHTHLEPAGLQKLEKLKEPEV
jgi:hypothetical protein